MKSSDSTQPLTGVDRPPVIESCKVESSQYMRHLCALFLADNWLWPALPVAVCGMMAVWIDVRFAIVALMILFIVLPMVLALLYFYYGLSPEARWSIMEKSVKLIDSRRLELTFADERMKKHVINLNDVRNIIEKEDVVMLMIGSRRYSCLMLPTSVINPNVAQSLRQLVAQRH